MSDDYDTDDREKMMDETVQRFVRAVERLADSHEQATKSNRELVDHLVKRDTELQQALLANLEAHTELNRVTCEAKVLRGENDPEVAADWRRNEKMVTEMNAATYDIRTAQEKLEKLDKQVRSAASVLELLEREKGESDE